MKNLDETILAAAINSKKFTMELIGSVDEKYFAPEYRWVYEAIKYYFNNPTIHDVPSRAMIIEYLADKPKPKDRLLQYDLMMKLKTQENESGWMLDKLRFRRNNDIQIGITSRLQATLDKPTSKARVEEANELLKKSIVDIDSIHKRATYKEGKLAESAQERIDRYKYIKENPEMAQGIMTGFTTFDMKTNGLHPGEFMIIAGDTGTGKSILMHNIAVNAYLGKNDPFDPEKKWDDRGKNILYFSLEMPKESMERRIDSCTGEIYSNHIRDGLLDEASELKYFRTLSFQAQYEKKFHIVDMPKGATTREIELKYIEVCEQGWKPDLVVVDYMGIMSPNNASGSDWMDLGVISAELHEFARVYEIAVITGSQVNRTKDGVERYDTDRIARSSMIPHNADVVLQIAKRSDEYVRSDVKVYIIKLRDGDKGDPFTLSKDFEKMKVRDLVDESITDDDAEDFI